MCVQQGPVEICEHDDHLPALSMTLKSSKNATLEDADHQPAFPDQTSCWLWASMRGCPSNVSLTCRPWTFTVRVDHDVASSLALLSTQSGVPRLSTQMATVDFAKSTRANPYLSGAR